MHYCRGCGVELVPTLKAGRPRKWCEVCKPRPLSVAKHDHDYAMTLEAGLEAEADDVERQERESRHSRPEPKKIVDDDDPDGWL